MLAAAEDPTFPVTDPDLVRPEAATAATPSVLTIISHVVEKLVARNDWIAQKLAVATANGCAGKSLETFNGVRAPSISIAKYLERIYKYTNCSPACFVVGYVYIDRLAHKHPGSLVVSLNVHRILVTCVMVASKMLDDVHFNNAFYARVGGVSNAEMNKLELELLFLLDFDVTVSSRTFESYCFHLEKEMLLNDAVPRVQPPLPSPSQLLHTTSSSSSSSLSSLHMPS